MQQIIEEYGGTIEMVLPLFTTAPNEDNGDPLDITEQAGRDLFIE